MSWSLGGLDLGVVQGEHMNLDTGLMIINIPGLPASQGIALSITGLALQITITGSFITTSKALAQAFLFGTAGADSLNSPADNSLLGLVGSSTNAALMQTSPLTYSSDFYSSVSGKIKTVDYEMVLGSAYSLVQYTIEFLVIS